MAHKGANWLGLVVIVLLGLGCCNAHAGYTHYFRWHQKPGEAELKQCVTDMRRVIEARKEILAGGWEPWTTNNPPEIGQTNVAFNGLGDNAHEPFVFPGEVGFNFCKTGYKPYDEVVTACLLVARDHFPPNTLDIKSDGTWGDWEPGAKLYWSVFGHRPSSPFVKPKSEVSRKVFWMNIGTSLVVIVFVIGVMRSRRWVA